MFCFASRERRNQCVSETHLSRIQCVPDTRCTVAICSPLCLLWLPKILVLGRIQLVSTSGAHPQQLGEPDSRASQLVHNKDMRFFMCWSQS